jgi:hypothetical protein
MSITKQQLVQTMIPITAMYNQDFTKEQYALWYQIFADTPLDKLEIAIKQHLTDPDGGRFFPTAGHILQHLLYSDAKVKLISGQEFDDDPSVDGTDLFVLRNESNFDRAQRRREYIARELETWHDFSTAKKLWYSGTLTEQQYLSLDTKKLEVTDETTQ